MQEARILVLDELTVHLDVNNKIKVLGTIGGLVDERKVEALIMSLHDPQITTLYSDKVILLSDSEIIA